MIRDNMSLLIIGLENPSVAPKDKPSLGVEILRLIKAAGINPNSIRFGNVFSVSVGERRIAKADIRYYRQHVLPILIRKFKPKGLCSLGHNALRILVGGKPSLQKLIGGRAWGVDLKTVYRKQLDIPVFAMYHPSMILYRSLKDSERKTFTKNTVRALRNFFRSTGILN